MVLEALDYVKKKIDDFEVIPGVDGHILFVPRVNSQIAFHAGRVVPHIEKEDLIKSTAGGVRKVFTDYKVPFEYIKKGHDVKDKMTRARQVASDTFAINVIGSKGAEGAVAAGTFSGEQIKRMSEAISKNRTLTNNPVTTVGDAAAAVAEAAENKEITQWRSVTLRIRGPKSGATCSLPGKLKHPPFEELFVKNENKNSSKLFGPNQPSSWTNSTNELGRLRGGGNSISLENVHEIYLERSKIKDQTSFFNRFFDFISKNKNKIIFILISGSLIYLLTRDGKLRKKLFKKLKVIFQKIKMISNHWVFQNRLVKGLIILSRYS